MKSFLRRVRNDTFKVRHASIRRRIAGSSAPRSSFSPPRGWTTSGSPSVLTCPAKSSANGGNASFTSAWPVWKIGPERASRVLFPPELVVEIKALACQLPSERGLPFSRLSYADVAREAVQRGLVASISSATVWRWLSADAIKPWSYRSWIFPRDPNFAEIAARVLDLYQGVWAGEPLGPDEYVLSSDEKTSIQARRRVAVGANPGPRRTRRVEFEYERRGALAYLGAWDVGGAKLFGLCEPSTGIEPYHRLVDLVMGQEPYRSARRVFWITDNGSSHRGQRSRERLSGWYPNAIQIHTPVHASWLNQIEIYFSILQRKVLTPNDFSDLAELESRILAFQSYYEQIAKPFEWRFTRADLNRLLSNLSRHDPEQDRPAA